MNEFIKNINLMTTENTKKAAIFNHLIVGNINYLLNKNITEEAIKILNKYINKGIGDKRQEEIAKKIGKIILKKAGVGYCYREKTGKYSSDLKDYNDNIIAYEDSKELFYITIDRRCYYEHENLIDISFNFKGYSLKTLTFEQKENNFVYISDKWDKLIYTEPNQMEMITTELIKTYNNSIIKIKELEKEIEKQKNNINCEYIRTLSNRSLYIYGDYRDKLIEV